MKNFNPRPPCGGRLLLRLKTLSLHHFNPRPPCGGRHWEVGTPVLDIVFQSTSPVWRTTKAIYDGWARSLISIHVPRVEDDTTWASRRKPGLYFNPRPPCGGRLSFSKLVTDRYFISIHVPRVEDDPPSTAASIHVPRVEDDTRARRRR